MQYHRIGFPCFSKLSIVSAEYARCKDRQRELFERMSLLASARGIGDQVAKLSRIHVCGLTAKK